MANVPNPWHDFAVNRIQRLLSRWDDAHPGPTERLISGGGTRLVVPPFSSDRHPDLAVYETLPPSNTSRAWWTWTPTLAVEIVSRNSRARDHEEKPPEYLAFGVGEYWVFDPSHPDRPGPSARVFTRTPGPDGADVWAERWEDEVVTSDRFPGLSVPVADVLAPLPVPIAEPSVPSPENA